MPTTRLSVKKEAQDESLQGEIVHRIKQEVKQEPLEDKKKIEPRQIKQEVKQEPREHKQEVPDIKPERKMLDENGNSYWELGGNKRATLSKFKGTEYLNIRQYYHDADSGEVRPSKKGITLRKAEWEIFKSIHDEIQFE